MVSISDVTGILTLVSIVFGMGMAVLQLRDIKRERQARLLMDYNSFLTSSEWKTNHWKILNWEWEDFDDMMKKYGPETNPEAFGIVDAMGSTFQGLAWLMDKKLIDEELIKSRVIHHWIMYWEKFGDYVLQYRERFNNPYVFIGIEQYYNKWTKR